MSTDLERLLEKAKMVEGISVEFLKEVAANGEQVLAFLQATPEQRNAFLALMGHAEVTEGQPEPAKRRGRPPGKATKAAKAAGDEKPAFRFGRAGTPATVAECDKRLADPEQLVRPGMKEKLEAYKTFLQTGKAPEIAAPATNGATKPKAAKKDARGNHWPEAYDKTGVEPESDARKAPTDPKVAKDMLEKAPARLKPMIQKQIDKLASVKALITKPTTKSAKAKDIAHRAALTFREAGDTGAESPRKSQAAG